MNLHDIAKRAGVSIATVSRVVNNSDIVRSPTRARVQKILEECNYHPNVNARALSANKSHTLGVIVSNLRNQYFLDILLSIESDAHRKGFELFIAQTDYLPERLVASVKLMLGRRVGALAVIVSEMDTHLIKTLAASKIPVVFSGVATTNQAFTNIKVDTHKGMLKILDYLRAINHRRIAFVGHHDVLETISERKKAFLESRERFGGDFESLVASDSDSIHGGRQAVSDVLASGFQPTAVVCVNDLMAIGVLKELRARGIRVPQDISVTGFDNIEMADAVSPALTTAHIPRDRMGHMLFANLMQQRAGVKQNPREVIVDPELVLRESTAPLRI